MPQPRNTLALSLPENVINGIAKILVCGKSEVPKQLILESAVLKSALNLSKIFQDNFLNLPFGNSAI
jgi:hypothetical protein